MLTILCSLAIFGCSGSNSPSVTAASSPDSSQSNVTKIRLQLNWIPDAQHGGFYAAQVAGHFADAKLDVEILAGGPGTPAITKVATGRCDFAIANADQVLLARAQGADVVAVFASMQDSPRCIMVHESSSIRTLQQLSNLTLALGDGKAFAEYLKMHVPLQDVRIVSYAGNVAKFLVDKNYAQQGYVFSEPLVAKAQGGDPLALMVSELGFNPYSSVVVTKRATWESNPELVRRFVSAVRLGWTSYFEQPAATNTKIMSVNAEMDAAILAASVQSIRKLCLPTATSKLGQMTTARWEQLGGQLIELEILSEDAADVVKGAYIPMEDE